MPSLQQIIAYCRIFRMLRGRKPSVSEVQRYFADWPVKPSGLQLVYQPSGKADHRIGV
jgi:hypothetical protein